MANHSLILGPRQLAPKPDRLWQRDCHATIEVEWTGGYKDFLVSVTPGGGKTILGLEQARRRLATDDIDVFVALAPSIAIQNYWIEEAKERGLNLSSSIQELADNSVIHCQALVGAVVTYQMLAGAGAKVLEELCAVKRVLVVADEIHHGAISKPWGDAIFKATERAVFRLGLTGTPYRSDDHEMAILRYTAGKGVPHFEYTYKMGLVDGVVAPVYFRWLNGTVSSDSERVSFDQSATMTDTDAARLLTIATASDSAFSRELLAQAHSELMKCRETDADAGGLVISQDIKAAQAAYGFLKDELGADAVIVVSANLDAHDVLEKFKTSKAQWCVSVAMVNEGVDIVRLKVLAYLSNNTTRLAFDQAIGRIVRITPDRADQLVFVHLPKIAFFEEYARSIEEAREHVIKHQPEPAEPRLRYCAECGEASPSSSAACEHCGHEFPARSRRTGAVVFNSDGFLDGATVRGLHFREDQMETVIDLLCRTDAHEAELRREGRTAWCGRRLERLALMAEREGISLDDKLREAASNLQKMRIKPRELSAAARHAGTRRAWGL